MRKKKIFNIYNLYWACADKGSSMIIRCPLLLWYSGWLASRDPQLYWAIVKLLPNLKHSDTRDCYQILRRFRRRWWSCQIITAILRTPWTIIIFLTSNSSSIASPNLARTVQNFQANSFIKRKHSHANVSESAFGWQKR